MALPVRIAIDARPLAHPHTGIGRYTGIVVEGLTEMGYEILALSAGNKLFKNLWVSNFRFAGDAHRANADVFWSPRHHLPVGLKIPSVVTIHDLVWRFAPQTMARGRATYDGALMRYAVNRADQIIAVSQHTKSDLLKVFPAATAKTEVISLAPTISQTNLPDASLCSLQLPEAPYILMVGTSEPRKNLERSIEAYQLSNVNANLVLVTNPGWKTNLDLTGVIHLTNLIDAELAQAYQNCEFVLAPSLYEGFGLQVAEAAAFGKAVITSNVASLPEVCAGAGLLVNPYNTNEIAQAITNLYTETSTRRKLEKQGLRNNGSRSWNLVVEQTASVITAASQQT